MDTPPKDNLPPERGCVDLFRRENSALAVYQFSVYDFLGATTDAIHTSDPFHLIVRLEPLGDAFALGHLADQQRQHIVCLLVDLGDGLPSDGENN